MKRLLAVLIGLLLLAGCAGAPQQSGTGSSAQHPAACDAGSSEQGGADQSNGETASQPPVIELPSVEEVFASLPDTFTFASGSGGWRTQLSIQGDGTFTGTYSDSDMGVTGADYPNGTEYICTFSGVLSQPQQINDYTYSCHLEELKLDATPDQVYIENGKRYIYANAYGLDDADEIQIYWPGAPVAQLPEMFMNWISWTKPVGADWSEYLPDYGLYNVTAQQGFAGRE